MPARTQNRKRASARKHRPAADDVGHRPGPPEIAAAKLLLEPWQWLTAPKFYNVEQVPTQRPFLLVGNHTLMGLLDVPLMIIGLYERRGVMVRSLGDHFHFQVPLWRDLLTRFGAVDGTRENCETLMRAGESILVFPGGAREVFKHKGEKYHLIWKRRIGFAALAIKHQYPVVPFAAVGAEECYDILIDGDELRHSPIGPLLERVAQRPDAIPPIVSGIGLLPRPQRFYFQFAEPIGTEEYSGRYHDQDACMHLRTRCQKAIEHGIASLKRRRARDPQRELPARLLKLMRTAQPARQRRRRA